MAAPALDPHDLAVLPVDELALWLLRELSVEPRGVFRRANTLEHILKRAGERLPGDAVYQGPSAANEIPHLGKALAEAWDWLIANGLLAESVSAMFGGQMPIEGQYFVTRFGNRVVTHERPREWLSAERRLGVTLHPRLEDRARRQFIMGEFEAAALISMREVEIAVREQACLAETVIGTDLMNKAFANAGPLTDRSAPPAEQEGMRSLYRAAISVFKNPASHRRVTLSDPTEAAEVVLFADLLLRMLDNAAAANRTK